MSINFKVDNDPNFTNITVQSHSELAKTHSFYTMYSGFPSLTAIVAYNKGEVWVKNTNPTTLYFTDSNNVDHPLGSGSGSVTLINTGAGLIGGPITTTGTISIPAAGVVNSMLANNSIT